MTLIVLLFAIGILLILAEVLVPGAILGTIGCVFMVIGCVVSFIRFGSGGGMISVAVAVVVLGAALYTEFRILPRTKIGRRAFLTQQVTGVAAAVGEEARELIGKSAEALTMLSPSGYVRVDGQRYEAFCQSGQAPIGAALEVIGADRFRLIVTQSTVTPWT